MKIIHTDNFGGDYPDEKFVEGLPHLPNSQEGRLWARSICDAINKGMHPDSPRYYIVVEDDHVLEPGFEP